MGPLGPWDHWNHLGPWDHWDHGTMKCSRSILFMYKRSGVLAKLPSGGKRSSTNAFFVYKTLKLLKNYFFDIKALEFGPNCPPGAKGSQRTHFLCIKSSKLFKKCTFLLESIPKLSEMFAMDSKKNVQRQTLVLFFGIYSKIPRKYVHRFTEKIH